MSKTVLLVLLAVVMILISCNNSTVLSDDNNPSEEIPLTPVQPEPSTDPETPVTPEHPESPEKPETIIFGTPEIGFSGFVNHGDYATAAIWMKTAWQSAKIFYTTDGSVPSESNGSDYRMNNHSVVCISPSGMQYVASGVEVPPRCTIKAVAFFLGSYSDISTFKVPKR